MRKIPLLLYHDFYASDAASKDNFAVAREGFAEQMSYLSENGFEAVSLGRFVANLALSQKGKLDEASPRKKVILTFDDDDVSHYDFVLPHLRSIGFTGTFFITVNEVGAERQMDWAMIRDLAASGMEIGSHGLVHTFLPARDDRTLADELAGSKRILEEKTAVRVDSLSVPHGFYNNRVVEAARAAGFTSVCVSDAGYVDFSGPVPFVLKRFPMRGCYDLSAFRSIVEGHPAISIAAAEGLRTALRNVLGYRVYDKMRSVKYGTRHV